MTVWIDQPIWPAPGRLFAHLASDTSYEELPAVARAAQLHPRAFDVQSPQHDACPAFTGRNAHRPVRNRKTRGPGGSAPRRAPCVGPPLRVSLVRHRERPPRSFRSRRPVTESRKRAFGG